MNKMKEVIDWVAIGLSFCAGVILLVYGISTLKDVASQDWTCIQGGEDVGFARVCEVSDCHILFLGEDVLMECD